MAGLREATDDDGWAVVALVAACWAEYPGCVTDVAGEYPGLAAPASDLRRRGGTLWVLPEGRWIGGCVGLAPGDRPGRVELRQLYVARHLRRRGLGRDLVGWVEHQPLGRRAAEVELWSDTRFADAHRLYERLGYRRTGETRDLHDKSATVEYHFLKALG